MHVIACTCMYQVVFQHDQDYIHVQCVCEMWSEKIRLKKDPSLFGITSSHRPEQPCMCCACIQSISYAQSCMIACIAYVDDNVHIIISLALTAFSA